MKIVSLGEGDQFFRHRAQGLCLAKGGFNASVLNQAACQVGKQCLAVRGVAFESYERAIDAHVKNIRRKLEPDPHEPHYVLTVYGVGYKFAELE